MRTEPCDSRSIDRVGYVLAGIFIVLSIVFACVAIWAIVRLVLHYT